ncbi:MAG: hypothetical protein ACXWCB_02460 [Acidimicrobiales bacterium]
MRSSIPTVTTGSTPGLTRARPADRGLAELDQVAPGDEIEIWCRSLGAWSSGFVAVDLGTGGWRVLRRSDRTQLPVRFPDAEVRLLPAASPRHTAG